MDYLDRPLEQILALPGLPEWLKSVIPQVWHFLLAGLIMAVAYVISLAVKGLVRAFGKRKLKGTDLPYEGSLWDMADSAAQIVVMIAALPLALTVMGINVMPYLRQNSGGMIAATVIMVFAIIIARWLSGSVRAFGVKAQAAHRGNGTLFMFLGAMVSYLVIGFALVLSLTQLGVQSASLIALVGAAGLAIALALQDTLKAVAGGVMLAIFRPYRIGDWVNIAGKEGEVIDITPFRTVVKPPTNQGISLPNDQVWTQPILNSSTFARRRLDLYLDVSYEDNVDKAIEVTLNAVNALPRTLAKDETWVGVHAFKDWSVQLRCRVWCATPEFVQMRSDCLRAIKAAYAEHGITIPYPHQVEMVRMQPGTEAHYLDKDDG